MIKSIRNEKLTQFYDIFVNKKGFIVKVFSLYNL